MMRFCPKCGELYADQLLAFCLADGAPLGAVAPGSDVWKEGSRAFEQKQKGLKTQQRKLKWRRVTLATMLIATLVVSVAAVSRSISVTVVPPEGKLCITAFNDLNSNGVQDAGEPGLSGSQVQVRGTDLAKTFTTDLNGSVCPDLPVGSCTVIVQPQNGWFATTLATQTVTLVAHQPATVLFGSRQGTELRIAKFDDLNHNGVRDAGEPGVSGIVFQVRGTDVTTTLTTGPDGVASAVVPVGTYTVVESPPEGSDVTTPTTETVTVTDGPPVDLPFPLGTARGTLCIRTFDDSNSNHAQDASEVGLPGFVFKVHRVGTAITLATNLNGICSDLPVGTYTVIEQSKSGWIATTPATKTVTITSGNTTNVLFGNRRETGRLCITAFNDRNGNRSQDKGEPAISGVVFQVNGTGAATTLTTDLRDSVCSLLPVGIYTVVEHPPGGWIATTPTPQTVNVTSGATVNMSFGSRQETGKLCIKAFDDLNGNHLEDKIESGLSSVVFQVSGTDFEKPLTTDPNGGACSDLPAGTYKVTAQLQSGWIATTPTTQTVNVTAGLTANIFFGMKRETGKLCLKTFNDINANQVQDKNEAPWSNVVFELSGTGAPTTLTTDVRGGACSDLPAGTYTLVELLKNNWIATTPTTKTVSVTAGLTVNMSFGIRQEVKQETGKLCISAFADLNNNRVKDATEPPLAGIRFQVGGTDVTKSLIIQRKEATVCSELRAGEYTIVEQVPDGWITTTPAKLTVLVTAGQNVNVSFGNKQEVREERGSLCIRTFYDRNRNGFRDPDERGLRGFAFQVNGTGAVITLTTDVDGEACSPLPFGTYTVMQTKMPGWIPTTPTKQPVTITAKKATLFFGNTGVEPECDQSREWQLILNQYGGSWRKSIEGEREKIIAENVPRNTKYEITLGQITPRWSFRNCNVAIVVLKYAWLIEIESRGPASTGERRRKTIPRERTYVCQKAGGHWICPN